MSADSVPELPRTRLDALSHLVILVGDGDREAFTSLYDVTATQIFRHIRRVLVDTSQAEEVTQEVFLEIWQTAARYQPERAGAMTWMLTIARRRAIDRVRSSQSSRDRDFRVGMRHIDDDYDTVAMDAETRSDSDRVRRAMQELTVLQRQAVELSYFDELSLSEISTQLLVPVGTVKTRIRDGILRLRATVSAMA